MGKGILLPAPKLAMKLALGEQADMILTGQRVRSKKIEEHGFKFEFNDLKSALEDIYN